VRPAEITDETLVDAIALERSEACVLGDYFRAVEGFEPPDAQAGSSVLRHSGEK